MSMNQPLFWGWIAVVLVGATLPSQAYQIPTELAESADPWGVLPLTRASTRALGAPSCSASACHGGPAAGVSSVGASRGSEYPLWIESDPHARSWRTLNSDRSVEILERLQILIDGKIANPAAYKNCLACHNTSTELTSDGILPAIPEGVGCEACHGPAEAWRDSHYQGPGSVQIAIDQLGMVNTASEPVRAKACSLCHVGGPDRDMNHDIIAAGHPALYFDYATYLNAYPKHWREEPRNPPALALERWLIGQVTKADSELELIETRIASAHPHSTWPEFSNQQCTSCHQPLEKSTPVKSTPGPLFQAARVTPGTPLQLGKASIRMWNLEGLVSIDRVQGTDSVGTNDLLDSLQRSLSGGHKTTEDLEGLLGKIDAKRLQLQGVFPRTSKAGSGSVVPTWSLEQHRAWTREKWNLATATGNWEQAALAYLSTLASSPPEEAIAPLQSLRNRLVFPESTQSPIFPKSKSGEANSDGLQSDSRSTDLLASDPWLADLALLLKVLGP
jgi:hypothetical protein